MTKKLVFLFFISLLGIFSSVAQIVNPVNWEKSIKTTSETSGEIIFTATIDDGWHMYGLELPAESGIQATTVEWNTLEGVKLVGELTPSRPAHEAFDAVMDMKLSWWEKDITLTQKFDITDKSYKSFINSIL